MGAPGKVELLRLALRERGNPTPFYAALAERMIADLPIDVAGCQLLDLGSGTGHNAMALAQAGATVVALDVDVAPLDGAASIVRGDALRLPFDAGSFDGVFSSNMLEHVPSPAQVLDELARVVRPGGWAWVSWTNWYSPWGGHSITPLHYLGAERGVKVWTKLFGAPQKNLPGVGLFPTHIAQVFDLVEQSGAFELEDAYPRYYPTQRWVLRVPGVREVLTWNCVLVLRRRGQAVPS